MKITFKKGDHIQFMQHPWHDPGTISGIIVGTRLVANGALEIYDVLGEDGCIYTKTSAYIKYPDPIPYFSKDVV